MSQVYNLDLQTMLSTLSRRQLSGRLAAEIARGRVGRDQIHIEISVDSGKVIFCSLRSGRTYVTGENALQMIAQLEVIPWIFTALPAQGQVSTPQQPTSPMPQPAPSGQQLLPIGETSRIRIPKRLGTLQQTDLAYLPRSHFQVYAYIDGKRTVEEIAQQLRATTRQVERVLADLEMWRVVQ